MQNADAKRKMEFTSKRAERTGRLLYHGIE